MPRARSWARSRSTRGSASGRASTSTTIVTRQRAAPASCSCPSGRRTRSWRPPRGGSTGSGPVVRVGARVRPARAVPGAAAVRPAVPGRSRTRARWPRWITRWAPCSRPRALGGSARARRRHRRPRRGPRRTRRSDPRPVRLRGDAAGAADRRRRPTCGRTSPDPLPPTSARHIDIVPTIADSLGPAGARGPAGTLAATRGRAAARRGGAVVLRGADGLAEPGLGTARPAC